MRLRGRVSGRVAGKEPAMGKIIKTVLLAWIGKLIYNRISRNDEPQQDVAEPTKRGKRKTSTRAA
jgi:hypothetical protein